VVEELRRLEYLERGGLPEAWVPPASPPPGAPPTGGRRPGPLGLWLGGGAILAALVVGAVMAYQKLWPAGESDEDREEERPAVVDGGKKPPIKVGFLFSTSGPLVIHEKPILYAAHLAVDEINRAGGVLGRPIEAVDANGASKETVFAEQADRLLKTDRVQVIFGCWTSASRKRVAEVCDKHDRLLFFPCSYEGLEESPHVVYLGGTPNQTVIPLIHYAYTSLKRRRFFLAGSEAVYSLALEAILKDEIRDLGGQVAGTGYLPVGDTNGVGRIVDDVKKAIAADKAPLFIINSMDGSGNVAFCNALRKAGVRPDKVPTAWLNISEPELSQFRPADIAGDYSAACYFESLDLASNRAFLERLRKRYIQRERVNDPMEATYAGVYLWKKAVEKAGSLDTGAVRQALRDLSVDAPEGPIRIDPGNLHAWRTARVGRVVSTAEPGSKDSEHAPLRFEVVHQSPGPIRPIPFPASRTPKQWRALLDRIKHDLGGAWEKH
jgi:urea transport system substrate-binding protein